MSEISARPPVRVRGVVLDEEAPDGLLLAVGVREPRLELPAVVVHAVVLRLGDGVPAPTELEETKTVFDDLCGVGMLVVSS